MWFRRDFPSAHPEETLRLFCVYQLEALPFPIGTQIRLRTQHTMYGGERRPATATQPDVYSPLPPPLPAILNLGLLFCTSEFSAHVYILGGKGPGFDSVAAPLSFIAFGGANEVRATRFGSLCRGGRRSIKCGLTLGKNGQNY